MPTKMTLNKDQNSNVTYGIPFVSAPEGHAISLAAAGTATLTVPEWATVALCQIQPGATVWIGPDAITPAAAAFGNESADINPALRDVRGVATLHFYAVDAAQIKVSFYEG
tara:strand:+ start:4532 stop:4864 length:333 start_codon:yes stop_codon:yes gene_type:complete